MLKRRLDERLVGLLVVSGAVVGPYRRKRGRITRGEARALRNVLCSADERALLDPELVSSITVEDMQTLCRYAGD